MLLKDIQDENFQDYKKPSMFLAVDFCDWKCCKEANLPTSVCQNSALAKMKSIDVDCEEIYQRYISNPITSAIVVGGLEPFCKDDIYRLIETFRNHGCEDDFVIYTGYNKNEIIFDICLLAALSNNIVVKFGRYVPDQLPHYDEVLGVYLASDNQYAERIC